MDKVYNVRRRSTLRLYRGLPCYIEEKEEQFVKEGGIKERMHAARTGYRKEQDERLAFLERENQELKAEIKRLQELLRNK